MQQKMSSLNCFQNIFGTYGIKERLNSYFIRKMEVHMLNFIALIICFVGGIYFLCSGNPLFGILDIVLACLNFKPAVEWLSTFI